MFIPLEENPQDRWGISLLRQYKATEGDEPNKSIARRERNNTVVDQRDGIVHGCDAVCMCSVYVCSVCERARMWMMK